MTGKVGNNIEQIRAFVNNNTADHYRTRLLDWLESTILDNNYCRLAPAEKSKIVGVWRLTHDIMDVIFHIAKEFEKTNLIEEQEYTAHHLQILEHYIEIASPGIHKRTIIELYRYYFTATTGEGDPAEERWQILNDFIALTDICVPLHNLGAAIVSIHVQHPVIQKWSNP